MSKSICPKCKSNNVVPIMYGYPAIKATEGTEKGNLKLGGCMVYDIDGGGWLTVTANIVHMNGA